MAAGLLRPCLSSSSHEPFELLENARSDRVSMLNARVDELLFRIRLLEEVPDVTDAASAVSDLNTMD